MNKNMRNYSSGQELKEIQQLRDCLVVTAQSGENSPMRKSGIEEFEKRCVGLFCLLSLILTITGIHLIAWAETSEIGKDVSNLANGISNILGPEIRVVIADFMTIDGRPIKLGEYLSSSLENELEGRKCHVLRRHAQGKAIRNSGNQIVIPEADIQERPEYVVLGTLTELNRHWDVAIRVDSLQDGLTLGSFNYQIGKTNVLRALQFSNLPVLVRVYDYRMRQHPPTHHKLTKDEENRMLLELKDPNAEIRAAVATALGNYRIIRTDAMEDALALCLDDPVFNVRRNAAVSLSRFECAPELAIPKLIELFENESNADQRGAMIGSLGGYRHYPEWVMPVLRRALHDRSSIVRWSSSMSLMSFGPGGYDAVSDLIPMLKDNDPAVRRAVASALKGMEATEAIPALEAAIRDPDPLARNKITYALVRLKQIDAKKQIDKKRDAVE